MRKLSLALGLLVSTPTFAQTDSEPAESGQPPYERAHVDRLTWRNIGPSNMGGRVTDIAASPRSFSTWYVATAGAGLWKTKNAGTTWEILFDDQSTVSIGDVAVAPSKPDVVWVGTGEENGRNSVSWGDGVYKSTDGGKTFECMGLEKTFQIGHIAIHPQKAEIVYVAALGRLWSHNPDRGVYRTKNGGETWEKVLYLDEKTGAIDVRIDPNDPHIVYACMYERFRDQFDGNDPIVRFGEKSGFYKSNDGGDTWREITDGLPSCQWGRSGMTVYSKDPKTLYMTVETERSGWATGEKKRKGRKRGDALMGVNGDAKDGGIELQSVTDGGAADKAGLKTGDIVLELGDKKVRKTSEFIAAIREKNAGDKVTVKYRRDGEDATTELTYGKRPRRGPDNGPNGGRLGGQQANKQEDQGDKGYETGGVFRSDDHGETWKRVNSLTDRPFYYSVIAVDPQNDQNVYSCGVPFYASFDGGEKFDPVHRGIHVDFHAIAIDPADSNHLLIGCDGGLYETWDRCKNWRHIDNIVAGQFYHANVDNAEPYNVYGGLQDNGTWGGPSRTRFRDGIRAADWYTIAGGDGFRARIDPEDPSVVFATSQNGGMLRQNVARARSAGRISKPEGVRWNWDTPFFLSPHNSRIFYFAGSKACRSIDRGRRSTILSDDLGLTDKGTATAFAESPRRSGLLYVGTDDGALWRSQDGGANWEEIHDKVLGMPGPRYVSHIEPSYYDTSTVYVTFEGHRSDDRDAHVYVSEDRGDTWTSLKNDLPNEPCHVIREFPAAGNRNDPGNPDLLFVGTEFGCYVSLDAGEHWMPLGRELPTVAVRDLSIQKRDTDLVAATHGRGIFTIDIEPLTQIGPKSAQRDVHLFYPEDATLWQMRTRSGYGGHAAWSAKNPAYGAPIYLWLKQEPKNDAKITIHDVAGKQVREIDLRKRAGMHAVTWDCRVSVPREDGEGESRRRRRRTQMAKPGDYSVRYHHEGRDYIRPLLLRADPAGNTSPLPTITARPTRGN